MQPPKRVSYTCQVLEALTQADDFRTLRQLMAQLSLSNTRVSASLHHLFKHKAVAAMAADEELYWYATPDQDDRSRHYDLRIDREEKRNRQPGKKHNPRRKRGELPKR